MTQKEKCIELMQQLDIYKPYIKGFRDSDRVCFFEGFGGFWVDQEPEVYAKMKEIEAEYGWKCYAITHENFEFGECYSFLMVSNYEEDWAIDFYHYDKPHEYCVFAYVWNKDDDYCSESGTIVVKSFGGGIARVG